jgi:protein tyrosine phosphatase domain-containing protein 1
MNFLKKLCCIPDKPVPKTIINNTMRNSTFNMQRQKIAVNLEDKDNHTYQPKDQFRCLFCGGLTCKHENWRNNPKTAINGLNCDLIEDFIFASQRPSTVLIKEYNLIDSFKEKNISLIVNVQREGEHPYCGPNNGLESSGFSYDPDDFIKEGIDVIHSGWKDMGVPDSASFILRIVKEIYEVVSKKQRVLVHCHAGYGRTGIVIACFLIYYYEYTAEKAVELLRSTRKKCIEKQEQFDYCKMFESCKKKNLFIFFIY